MKTRCIMRVMDYLYRFILNSAQEKNNPKSSSRKYFNLISRISNTEKHTASKPCCIITIYTPDPYSPFSVTKPL